MNKPKFVLQSKIIKVSHPSIPELVLFEAHVKIINLRTDLVDSIKKINIDYQLKVQS